MQWSSGFTKDWKVAYLNTSCDKPYYLKKLWHYLNTPNANLKVKVKSHADETNNKKTGPGSVLTLQLNLIKTHLSWNHFYSWVFKIMLVRMDLIIPHATSCGGYNVFDPSVSQSVRQSCFSCQRNSSETAQQNFMKLCSYEGHIEEMRISIGNFDSFFFSELRPFLT